MKMNLKELMEITPEDLASKQFEYLKQHTIDVLKNALRLIEMESFKEIDDICFHSPSGDGYGSDNNCLNFNYKMDIRENIDITEIVEQLTSLKSIIEKENKKGNK